ncbi:MAG UNVERIFIED_CONTAM: type II toxin-antitoxin system RelE/ParE family toxin [Microcystis novacekii LVE1205-3]
MEWNIIFDEDFRDWLYEQQETVQDSILAYIGLLKQKRPLLGRPYVDTLQGSRYPNLKELRVQHQGQPWRVLFAFDSYPSGYHASRRE